MPILNIEVNVYSKHNKEMSYFKGIYSFNVLNNFFKVVAQVLLYYLKFELNNLTEQNYLKILKA